MSSCKHRYEPTMLGSKYRTPNSYWWCCRRCGNTIFAVLQEKNQA